MQGWSAVGPGLAGKLSSNGAVLYRGDYCGDRAVQDARALRGVECFLLEGLLGEIAPSFLLGGSGRSGRGG